MGKNWKLRIKLTLAEIVGKISCAGDVWFRSF